MASKREAASLLFHKKKSNEQSSSARLDKIVSNLLKSAHKKQLELIEDTSRDIALLAPRRTGKTEGMALRVLIKCLRAPRRQIGWFSMTLKNARGVVWPLLQRLDTQHQIGCHFQHTEMVMTCPNGSKILLFSFETEDDVHKLRGFYLDEAVIDETQKAKPRILAVAIDQVLSPLLMDKRGTLSLMGTASPYLSGYFYDSTGPNATEVDNGRANSRPYTERNDKKWKDIDWRWSLHHWSLTDNTALQWVDEKTGQVLTLKDEAEEMKRKSGWTDDNPIWMREFLGMWVPDDTNIVYKYHPDRNNWTPGYKNADNPFGLPPGSWHYVLGVDLGHSDPFALQLFAYDDFSPRFYQCYAWERKGTFLNDWADEIKKIYGLVTVERTATGGEDALGEVLLHQFRVEYGIVIEKLKKSDKRDIIEILNAGLIDGHIKFNTDYPELAKECLYLSWDETGMKEKKSQKNNNTDATLYASCISEHRTFSEKVEVHKDLTQIVKEQVMELEENYANQYQERERDAWRDRDIGHAGRDNGTW